MPKSISGEKPLIDPTLVKALSSMTLFQEAQNLVANGNVFQKPLQMKDMLPYREAVEVIKKTENQFSPSAYRPLGGLERDPGGFSAYIMPPMPEHIRDDKAAMITYLDQQPAHDAETAGVAFGKSLAAHTGLRIVLLGEDHTEAAQWEMFVGIVRGLKTVGDKRQIILIEEFPRGDCESYSDEGLDEWNAGLKIKGGLGDAWAHVECEDGAKSAYDYFVGAFSGTRVPRSLAYNEISHLVPDAKLYQIDANADYKHLPHAPRDDAMALYMFALSQRFPDAIIIGSFGADHVTEYISDHSSKTDPRAVGMNLNDPLAEQLSRGIGRERVHTLRCVTHGKNGVYADASGKFVYFHDGTVFDAAIRIFPQKEDADWIAPLHWGK